MRKVAEFPAPRARTMGSAGPRKDRGDIQEP